MFSKRTPPLAAIVASVTAVVVHFSMYYGKISVPFTLATGENPGVAAAVAIVLSLVVGSIIFQLKKEPRSWRSMHMIGWLAGPITLLTNCFFASMSVIVHGVMHNSTRCPKDAPDIYRSRWSSPKATGWQSTPAIAWNISCFILQPSNLGLS